MTPSAPGLYKPSRRRRDNRRGLPRVAAVIVNLFWAYVTYTLCRALFIAVNPATLSGGFAWDDIFRVFRAGLVFDSSAIFYLNAPYLLLVLLPFHVKDRSVLIQRIEKWLYMIPNSLAIVLNIGDAAAYVYRGGRTSAMVFSEFANESNVAGVVLSELLSKWWLVLTAVAMIAGLAAVYRRARPLSQHAALGWYYISGILSITVCAGVTVLAMRGGGVTSGSRPISVNDASRYAKSPTETSVVLNTPFTVIRTIGNTPPEVPHYFDKEELDAIYSPEHYPADSLERKTPNIVVILLESFSAEYVGVLNRHLDGGNYAGYTPFLDSLIERGTTWSESFSNAVTSIDAMPAVLASIPRVGRPFILTPYSLNHLTSLPNELKNHGDYATAFFHGGTNGSMGFDSFAQSVGFDSYYGRSEYESDSRTGGNADFDGIWGIWDEEFMQYFAMKLGEMKQPFMATLFTLSSHHPFNVPERYKDRWPDDAEVPMYKCVSYTDNALKEFFEKAKSATWYDNTVFVLTADHGFPMVKHDYYKTPIGTRYRIPIIFYDPSGNVFKPGHHEGYAQQIDIMPTVLSAIGYNKPFVAFGQNLLATSGEDTWAFNREGDITQFVQDCYIIEWSDDEIVGVFDLNKDPLMRENIADGFIDRKDMEKRVKAITQSFLERMDADSVRM